jgi:transketolase
MFLKTPQSAILSPQKSLRELAEIAKIIRKKILDLGYAAKHAHFGGALSAVDILTTLYFGDVMRYDASEPESEVRDRLIFSKGHGALALYTALWKAGYITEDELDGYHTDGHFLQIHPSVNVKKGIEVSGGSLGQGLSLGAGIALALKMKNNAQSKVYVILGDGECNEGSIWEATAFAAHKKLDNLTIICDKNKLQSDGFTQDILDFEPFSEKWRSFGFEVIECDGHNFEALKSAFAYETNKPKCIIADTVKGKGVSFMENNKDWHHNGISQKQYSDAISELTGGAGQ